MKSNHLFTMTDIMIEEITTKTLVVEVRGEISRAEEVEGEIFRAEEVGEEIFKVKEVGEETFKGKEVGVEIFRGLGMGQIKEEDLANGKEVEDSINRINKMTIKRKVLKVLSKIGKHSIKINIKSSKIESTFLN